MEEKTERKGTLLLNKLEVNPNNHVVLYAAGTDSKNADVMCGYLKQMTGRIFTSVVDMLWLRNTHLHSKKGNDGSRARVPFVIGNCVDVFKHMNVSFNVKQENHNVEVRTVEYKSHVYIEGIDPPLVEFIDTALVVMGSTDLDLLCGIHWFAKEMLGMNVSTSCGSGSTSGSSVVSHVIQPFSVSFSFVGTDETNIDPFLQKMESLLSTNKSKTQ